MKTQLSNISSFLRPPHISVLQFLVNGCSLHWYDSVNIYFSTSSIIQWLHILFCIIKFVCSPSIWTGCFLGLIPHVILRLPYTVLWWLYYSLGTTLFYYLVYSLFCCRTSYLPIQLCISTLHFWKFYLFCSHTSLICGLGTELQNSETYKHQKVVKYWPHISKPVLLKPRQRRLGQSWKRKTVYESSDCFCFCLFLIVFSWISQREGST